MRIIKSKDRVENVPKRHAKKAYGGNVEKAPRILNF
jgi:hypothetical protein